MQPTQPTTETRTFEQIVKDAARDTVTKLGQTQKRKEREQLIANLALSCISYGIEFAVKNPQMFNAENVQNENEAINETGQ